MVLSDEAGQGWFIVENHEVTALVGGCLPTRGHLWCLTQGSYLPDGRIKYKKEKSNDLFQIELLGFRTHILFEKAVMLNE